MGYYSAITVRVEHHLGASDATRAKRSAVFGIVFAETVLLCTCVIALLCKRPLSYLFTTDKIFVEELHSKLNNYQYLFSDVFLLEQGVTNACGMQPGFHPAKKLFCFSCYLLQIL